jgi:hypothetical protein
LFADTMHKVKDIATTQQAQRQNVATADQHQQAL